MVTNSSCLECVLTFNEQAKKILQHAIKQRRDYLRSRTAEAARSDPASERRIQWNTLPENSAFYIISVLANLKTYKDDAEHGFVDAVRYLLAILSFLI